MRDPIGELVEALDKDGKPTLAWTIRWSGHGEEPVRAAWQRAWSPADMVRVLVLGNHPLAREAQRVASARALFEGSDVDRVRADAIRRLVVDPPDLATLMMRVGRGSEPMRLMANDCA